MASVFKRGGKSNRGGSYYIQWFDHTGNRRTKSARTSDLATAERIAAKLESDVALRRDGVIDPTLDAVSTESQRSIESHLADFKNKMQAANCTEDHVNRTARVIRAISEHAGFQAVADITADGVNRYVGKLRGENRSARTVQSHLTSIKAFTKWLADHHKLPRDPLTSVRKPNPKADRRRERRMLLPAEWPWLEAATLAGPERNGMQSAERLLLYRTAIQTALRSSSLRSLTRGRLFLDATPPYIVCKAKSTKNQKDARQYIRPELATALRAHITTKAPKAPVFDLPHATDLAKMLRADLAQARKSWLKDSLNDPDEYSRREQSDFLLATNHDGEVFDFHSLKHTCGAWLAMQGVHPKAVQTVMQHSSITLTMDTYGHLFPGQEADAVDRLFDVMAGPPEALKATGTDDAAIEAPSKAQYMRSSQDAKRCADDARGCDGHSVPSTKAKSPKPLRVADLGDDVRHNTRENQSRPGRTRTADKGIMSPLL